jgi:hypothetical protein
MMIDLAPRAVREAEACARRWRANRPDARFLFDDEQRVDFGSADRPRWKAPIEQPATALVSAAGSFFTRS